ncbi:MAG: hypothetical protein JJE10_04915 [Thermoleophilia bacterium]|nr:hypothetical protein [Thermoleophilia bacterium]
MKVLDRLVPPKPTYWETFSSDRVNVVLAFGTVTIAATVLAAQYTRLLGRRTSEQSDEEHLIDSAPTAAADAVGVAVEGYIATPRRETLLFNLLSGFLGAFAAVRLSTWAIREGHGPFRNLNVGGRHIHHFVPGILIAFGSGVAALLTQGETSENRIAVAMGIGIGLTFDEAALLLDMRDVYWSPEGLLSVQVSLATGATLGATVLTLRILGRGVRHQEAAGEIPASG